jgi:DME family drug/metabolite transporter
MSPPLAIGMAALGATLWGTIGVASRFVSPEAELPPMTFAVCRTVCAALTIYAFAALMSPAPMRRAGLGFLTNAAAFGAGAALYNCFAFAAFETVGVAVTVVVTMGAPPALTAGLDALRAGRMPSALRCAALACAMVGVGLATLSREAFDMTGAGALGALQLAAATAGWMIILYATRAFAGRYDAFRATGAGMVWATLFIAAAGLVAEGPPLRAMQGLSAADFGLLLYIGVGATGVAYLLFAVGMREARSVSGVAIAAMAEPAVAAALAFLVLHEPLGPERAAGVALIALAMALQAATERRAAPAIGAGQERAAA